MVAVALFIALAPIARLGPDDLRLDQNVVRAADHDEMFGVVAPDDDKLALAVEIEGIDDAQPQLPAAAGHPQPPAESQTEDEQDQQGRDDQREGGGAIGQGLVSTEPAKGLHKLLKSPIHGTPAAYRSAALGHFPGPDQPYLKGAKSPGIQLPYHAGRGRVRQRLING